MTVAMSKWREFEEKSNGVYKFKASSYEDGPPPRTMIMKLTKCRFLIWEWEAYKQVAFNTEGDRWMVKDAQIAQELSDLFSLKMVLV